MSYSKNIEVLDKSYSKNIEVLDKSYSKNIEALYGVNYSLLDTPRHSPALFCLRYIPSKGRLFPPFFFSLSLAVHVSIYLQQLARPDCYTDHRRQRGARMRPYLDRAIKTRDPTNLSHEKQVVKAPTHSEMGRLSWTSRKRLHHRQPRTRMK